MLVAIISSPWIPMGPPHMSDCDFDFIFCLFTHPQLHLLPQPQLHLLQSLPCHHCLTVMTSIKTPLHLTWGSLSSRHLASRWSTSSRLYLPAKLLLCITPQALQWPPGGCWKSVSAQNVPMWVAQMVMTGTPYLIEVIMPMCVQGLPLCPFSLCPPMLLQLLVTTYLFPLLPVVELQHSHHQQILLLTHQLHGYLHHFTLTMHLHASKLNWWCPFLQRYWMTKMTSHPSLLRLVLILNTENPMGRSPSEITLPLRMYNLKSLDVLINYHPHLTIYKKQRVPFYNVTQQSTRSHPKIQILYLLKAQFLHWWAT